MRPCAQLCRLILVFLLCAVRCAAQTGTSTDAKPGPETKPKPETQATSPAWNFNASIAGYIVPNDQSYGQPTVMADRNWLHLEARYNDEAWETGSIWVGYDFSWGKKLTLDLTPMFGGVFGKLNGVAPGYELTLSYGKHWMLYSSGEFVIDTDNHLGNFYYSWNEASYSLKNGLRFGAAAQRTRVYVTPVGVQRGPLVGYARGKWQFTTYVFIPGASAPTVVLNLSRSF